MNKMDFEALFREQLAKAVANAERRVGRKIPDALVIELHGAGGGGRQCLVSEALEHLYLGDASFYKLIDITVKEVKQNQTILFVRVSGHAPSSWSDTWDPRIAGPFKQIEAAHIIGT